MPWSSGDVDRFRKGLDDEEKAQWVAVANHTRLDCLDDGNTEEFCDALAVRAANAAMAETWIEIAIEGGPGSGNWAHQGVPGEVGGSTASAGGSGLPQKVRLSRHAFQRMAERRKFQSVKSALQTLESKETPPGDWHMTLRRGGKVDGYLAGTDGVVKTVLGAWYKAEKLSGPDLAEMAELWLEMVLEGGPGSGNWGHAGIPKQRGGSAPRGAAFAAADRTQELQDIFGDFDSLDTSALEGTWDSDDIQAQAGVDQYTTDQILGIWGANTNDASLSVISLHEDAAAEFGTELSPFQKTLAEQVNNTNDASAREFLLDEGIIRHSRGQTKEEEATILAAIEGRKAELADRQRDFIQAYNDDPFMASALGTDYSRAIHANSTSQRKALRVMYEKTQEDLRAKNIGPDDLVTLHRGMRAPVGAIGRQTIQGNALESWSVSKSVAADFARHYETGARHREGQEVILTTKVRARDVFSITTNGLGMRAEGEVVIFGRQRSVSVAPTVGIPMSKRFYDMANLEID